MKRFNLLFICLCMVFFAVAQPQQIIVKTKGEMGSDGKVIPGKPLSGVTIRLKEFPNVFVTNKDGRCLIPLQKSVQKGDAISIISVQKFGYQLVDLDFIRRTIAYSPEVPITIVMISTDELNKTKIAIERRIRRTLQFKLQEKEDEIDSLKSQNAITQEEYRNLLRKLYNDVENYVNLIGEMAEQYARIDYDELSEFDLEVYHNIDNGNFTKADSLIHSNFYQEKEISERIDQLRQERAELIDKYNSKKIKLMTDLAQDCYTFSKLYRIRLQYDSAAYYLEKRAALDTLNAEWNLDAGKFIMDYLFDKQNENKAKNYFDRSLQICLNGGEGYRYLPKALMYLGDLYLKWGNYKESLDYYSEALDKALDMLIDQEKDSEAYEDYRNDYSNAYEDPDYWQCLERMALAYNSMKQHDNALELLLRSLAAYQEFYPERKDLLANCHINIGTTYENMCHYSEAFEHYQSALSILDSISDYPQLEKAYCYNNLGSTCDRQEQYDEAINYYEKSLSNYTDIYGPIMDKQLNVGYLYNNLASTYYNKSDYNEALNYYLKALRILSFRLDKYHPSVRTVQENIMLTINELRLN